MSTHVSPKLIFIKKLKSAGLLEIYVGRVLEEADQQLFNKLCNTSDQCLHSLLPLLSTRHTTDTYLKEWAPHRLEFSYTPYT